MISLELLHAVVEKEVNEDGVDVCIGVLPSNFPPDEFNSPDAARYERINMVRNQILC